VVRRPASALPIPASAVPKRYHRPMDADVESFVDQMNAEIFAGLLRQHGLTPSVGTADALAVIGLWGQALGDFKVRVPNRELLMARGLLSRWQAGEFALDADLENGADTPPGPVDD